MPNYFDYIHESSFEDIDDTNIIYNEMDATMYEFDNYVQEGVGVKILIGVGIAAALAGLIALIIHLYKKNSEKGAKKKTEEAKKAAQETKKEMEAAAAESKSDESKSDESKSDESKSDESKSDKVEPKGGDTKVEEKKHWLKGLFKGKGKKDETEEKTEVHKNSFSYIINDDIFQEAVDESGTTNFLHDLEEEVALVCDLAHILAEAYQKSININAAFERAQKRIKGTPENVTKDVTMKELISPVGENKMTIDDIIYECDACIFFNNGVADLSGSLNKAYKEMNLAEHHAKQRAHLFDPGQMDTLKNIKDKIAMPAISRLQKKLTTANMAIISVMDENIRALKSLASKTNSIRDSIRADSNAYAYGSNLKKIPNLQY